MRKLIVVMGPSGAGKSRIGAALAKELDVKFFEGDAFQPEPNIAKMKAGTPLDDDDRLAWTKEILAAVDAEVEQVVVLACSALTPFVQEQLRSGSRMPIFLLLDVPRSVLAERITLRTDHFMPASLLDSQLDALQPPHDAKVIDAGQTVESVVAEAMLALGH